MPGLREDALPELLDVRQVAVVGEANSKRVVRVHGLGLVLQHTNVSKK